MVLFDIFKSKKQSKTVDTDTRLAIRAMLEEGATIEEARDTFPNVPKYYFSNIRRAIERELSKDELGGISKLTKAITAISKFQSDLVDNEMKKRKAIEDMIIDNIEEIEGSDEDQITTLLMKELLKRIQQQPQTEIPAQTVSGSSYSLPKTKIPSVSGISDSELKAVIAEIPKPIIKLIKKGAISKETCLEYVKKQGIDKATFERAWKLIK